MSFYKKKFSTISLYLCILLLAILPVNINAEQQEVAKPELGFWVGAANPLPGSPTGRILDTTLGFGFFGRFQWPYIFYTEIGGGMANYLSATERGLFTVPLYAALAYKLPFELPISIFLKAGGGSAYVIARPSNLAKWDPLAMGGVEFSFVAGRKVRIGLRLDYMRIIESQYTEANPATKLPYQSPYDRDPRLSNPNFYKLEDAEFFNFSLMVSFLL